MTRINRPIKIIEFINRDDVKHPYVAGSFYFIISCGFAIVLFILGDTTGQLRKLEQYSKDNAKHTTYIIQLEEQSIQRQEQSIQLGQQNKQTLKEISRQTIATAAVQPPQQPLQNAPTKTVLSTAPHPEPFASKQCSSKGEEQSQTSTSNSENKLPTQEKPKLENNSSTQRSVHEPSLQVSIEKQKPEKEKRPVKLSSRYAGSSAVLRTQLDITNNKTDKANMSISEYFFGK